MGKTYKNIEELVYDLEKEQKEYKAKCPIRWFFKEIYYHIYRFWDNRFRYLPKQIKWFFQRGKRGYSDYDVWGLWDYLGNVIYNSLKQLKKIKHGYPATINPKTGKYTYSKRRWDKILNKMIKGFKLIDDVANGDREFYLPHMPKDYRKKYKCLNKREDKQIKEAFDLFKQYFFQLWD